MNHLAKKMKEIQRKAVNTHFCYPTHTIHLHHHSLCTFFTTFTHIHHFHSILKMFSSQYIVLAISTSVVYLKSHKNSFSIYVYCICVCVYVYYVQIRKPELKTNSNWNAVKFTHDNNNNNARQEWVTFVNIDFSPSYFSVYLFFFMFNSYFHF